MSKKNAQHAEPVWPKGTTIPCPAKCGHPHVAKSGPCTKVGCGCYATKQRKVK